MVVPLIFVVGPIKIGKTKLVKNLSLDHIHDDLQKVAKDKTGHKITSLIKVPFNTKKMMTVFRMESYKVQLLTRQECIELCLKYLLARIEKAVEKAKEKPGSIVVVENNPIYYGHSWNGEFNQRYGTFPERKVIIELLRMDTFPLATFRFNARQQPLPGYRNGFIRLGPEDLKQMNEKYDIIYNIPSKNTGAFVIVSHTDPPSEWKIFPVPDYSVPSTAVAVEMHNVIIIYDGHIASGKTTLIEENAADDSSVALTAPMNEIKELFAMDIDDSVKTELRETCIGSLCIRQLDKAIELNPSGSFSIENNWVYAKWLFGATDEPYPVYDRKILKHFADKGLPIFKVRYIDVDIDTAYERMIKRDRGMDKIWPREKFEDFEYRFNLLYKGNYEWPFACVEIIRNEDKDEFEVIEEIEVESGDEIIIEEEESDEDDIKKQPIPGKVYKLDTPKDYVGTDELIAEILG